MDNEINSDFEAKFEGKILVVERTRYGNTTFVKNLVNAWENKRGYVDIKNTTFKGKRKTN